MTPSVAAPGDTHPSDATDFSVSMVGRAGRVSRVSMIGRVSRVGKFSGVGKVSKVGKVSVRIRVRKPSE